MADRLPPWAALATLAAALAARPGSALAGWSGASAPVPVTNAALVARLRAWRALLAGLPGRRYALYIEDSLEFGAALLGAWQAGKTIWLGADTLDASCAALAASVDGFLGQFPAACSPLSPLSPLAHEGDGEGDCEGLVGIADDFPALVVFTSGSTGAAQAIPKKLSQLASEVATLERLFGAAADAGADAAAVLATVSHQHIYGLLFKVLWPLSAGRPMYGHSIAYPEQLASMLAAGPCVLIASPAHLKRLPEHLDWRAAAHALRAVFSSGGPLAREAAQACGALLGRVPVEVYGSSETGGVAWRQRAPGRGGDTHEDAHEDDGWTPFPTLAWRLDGADGRLAVRSPHLEHDGWLTLADRARATDDGRFLLLGRADRIVKIEEKRISLDALEAALVASGLALDSRVLLCEPAPGARQTLAAFVVPTAAGRAVLERGGKPALNARLRAVLAEMAEAVTLPRRWRYLERLPVNAQGKTTQAALLALLARPDDGAAAAAAIIDADADAAGGPRFPDMNELELALEPGLEADGAARPRRVVLQLSAPASLFYFNGHFDGAPVLPGVAQLEWAIHYGRRYFRLPPRFSGVQALKFQRVIRPSQPVRLELLYDAAKGTLQFRYLSAEGQHASGKIAFLPAPGDAGHA